MGVDNLILNSQESIFIHKKLTFLAMEFKSFVLSITLFCAIFAQTYAKPTQATKEQIEFLQKNLPGEWKEDQYERDNLSNFLYEAGLNWIKRTYATSTNWKIHKVLSLKTVSSKLREQVDPWKKSSTSHSTQMAKLKARLTSDQILEE